MLCICVVLQTDLCYLHDIFYRACACLSLRGKPVLFGLHAVPVLHSPAATPVTPLQPYLDPENCQVPVV